MRPARRSSSLLVALAFHGLALRSAAAQETLNTVAGSGSGGHFAAAIALIPDVNADGFDDVLVGSPSESVGGLATAGRVRVLSGKDGTLLRTHSGTEAGESFGEAVSSLGADVDGDGVADYAAGSPHFDGTAGGTDVGRVRRFSGKTGVEFPVTSAWIGSSSMEHFGSSLAAFRPNALPSNARLLVGAPRFDAGSLTSAGRVYVIRVDGTAFSTISGASADDQLGYAVAAGADVNGDGVGDFVIGAPGHNSEAGRFEVHSGSSFATVLFATSGGSAFGSLGASVALLTDVNGDGFGDVLVGAPGLSSSGGLGRAFVFSGQSHSTLFDLTGGTGSGSFGVTVASAGDVDLDGRTDFLVGDSSADVGAIVNAGRVVLFRGSNGTAKFTFNGSSATGALGLGVAAGLNLCGDARPDVAIGAPFASSPASGAGLLRVFSGLDGSATWSLEGSCTGELAGQSLAGSFDSNGDGISDYSVGSPNLSAQRGSLRTYSTATGFLLWSRSGTASGDRFAFSSAPCGDVNLDGIVDLVVGAPQTASPTSQPGYVNVLSGTNGSVLITAIGSANGDEFGADVGAAGDLNADGVPDFLIGAPGALTDRGEIHVLSGKNGADITPSNGKQGEAAGDRFGAAVAGLGGSVDGDTKPDFLVGAPSNDAGGNTAGRVYVCRGSTFGGFVYSLTGTVAGDALGTSVAAAGDLNGDGKPDLLVGAPNFDGLGHPSSGIARAHSGANGAVLWSSEGFTFDRLGTAVASVGDVDFDGVPDAVAGASQLNNGTYGQGFARLISGKTGATIYGVSGLNPGEGFGSVLCAAGDVDQDGVPDLLASAPFDDTKGTDSGLMRVVSLRPQGVEVYGTGTPGCAGSQRLTANKVPKLNTPTYGLACNHAPASALGLLIVGSAQDLAGTNLLALGALFHVDFFASTFLTGLDMTSNAAGFAFAPAGIPNNPALVGATFYAQGLWVETACPKPPFNLSATTAVAYTVQP